MLKRIAFAFLAPIVLIVPLVALAGEAATLPDPQQTTALGLVLQGALILLSLALTFGLGAFGRFLLARTKGTIAENAVAGLWRVFSTAGEHFHASMAPEVREALADGKITPEEWAKLKTKLLVLVKAEFPGVISGAVGALGFLPAGVETFLGGLAEKALRGIVEKAGGTAPTSTPDPKATAPGSP